MPKDDLIYRLLSAQVGPGLGRKLRCQPSARMTEDEKEVRWVDKWQRRGYRGYFSQGG